MAAIQTEGADRVTTLVDHDRELLAATARRHHDALPVRASTALSAAVDELIDPLTLPALVDIDAAETDDATAVIAAVQERMRAAGGPAGQGVDPHGAPGPDEVWGKSAETGMANR
jgi:hypothetical protein